MAAPINQLELLVGELFTPVLESGPTDSADAVVFLHGNPGSCEDWRDLVGRVGEFARGVAFDLPGFGKADAPKGFNHRPEGYAEFIKSALKELGVDRAHLVMHDFGGPFGLCWAASNPDRFSSAVLFNTGLGTAKKWHGFARSWRRPLIGELAMMLTTRKRWHKAFGEGDGRPLPPEFIDRMFDDFDRDTRRTVLKVYRAFDLPYPGAEGWIEKVAKLNRPALVVWGRKDRVLAQRRVEEIQRAFPSAEIKYLEESGHFPFADDPEGTAELVVPWLRQQLQA